MQNLLQAEVINAVMAGFRTSQPPSMPDPIYQLLLKCWKQEAPERASFAAIAQELSGRGEVEYAELAHSPAGARDGHGTEAASLDGGPVATHVDYGIAAGQPLGGGVSAAPEQDENPYMVPMAAVAVDGTCGLGAPVPPGKTTNIANGGGGGGDTVCLLDDDGAETENTYGLSMA